MTICVSKFTVAEFFFFLILGQFVFLAVFAKVLLFHIFDVKRADREQVANVEFLETAGLD